MKIFLPIKLLVPILLLALLAAGCGGGGGGESSESTGSVATEPTALSKAEFISRGDAICAEVYAATNAVSSPEGGIAAEAAAISNLYVGMVKHLKELGAPAETAGYSKLMESAEEMAMLEGEVKLAAEREDLKKLEEIITKVGESVSQFEQEAGAYGFKRCSDRAGVPTPTPSGSSSTEAEEAGSVEEGGLEVEAESGAEEAAPEEAAPEEAAPETGGAGGAPEEAAPEGGGTGAGGGGGETGGSSGGVGPG